MPFTPYHVGPGILAKSLLRGSFSLMIFAWTQVVIDLQPLFVMITNEGRVHGFTHTYFGATLIAFFCALTGKYLVEIVLRLFRRATREAVTIPWVVAFLSAFIGSFTHVALDSVIYTDMRPMAPFSPANHLLGLISARAVYDLCVYSGLVGAVLYFGVSYLQSRHNKRVKADDAP